MPYDEGFRKQLVKFLIRQIMLQASQSNAVFVKVKEHTDSDSDKEVTSQPPFIGYFVTKLPRITLPRWQESGLYRIGCRVQDMPLAIINLRSIFGEEEPEVSYKSSSCRTAVKMALSQAQRLVGHGLY